MINSLQGIRRVLGVGWGQLTESQSRNVARFYSVCPEEVSEFLGGSVLNFGLWRTGREDHQTAAHALVREVAQHAGIHPGQSVLDVGCGFGRPALMFHQEYGAQDVVGLNITPHQLGFATASARSEAVDSSVRFIQGDATDMPLEDNSFDHVIALESAFHFSPREAFLREAYRVLRPGGRLTIADMVPTGDGSGRMLKLLAARLWLFPVVNHYGPQEYVRRLSECGFQEVGFRCIGRSVYLPYTAWTLSPANVRRLRKLLGWTRAQLYIWQTQILRSMAQRGLLSYGLIRALKEPQL